VKAELRSLPRGLADLVAQHLVASGRFIDDDPERAYLHARTARRLAARLGGVREAVAITAYLAEHYDEALTEFRAVRRMTGNHEVLAMMADCERALGRPEKALTLTRDKHARDLSEATQIELLIVAAGARRDLGQTAAAIQTLEVPELTKRTRAEWLPRLRYAYADALAEAGRTDDALIWFHRAAGVDAEGATGAADRAAQLEGLEFTDLDEDDDYEDDDTYDDQPDASDELDDDQADVSDEPGDDQDDVSDQADDELDDVSDEQDDVSDELDGEQVSDELDEMDGQHEVSDEQVAAADDQDDESDDVELEGVVDDALDGEVEPPTEKPDN
jgi:tetratricopeptide (TPR) repeat protein